MWVCVCEFVRDDWVKDWMRSHTRAIFCFCCTKIVRISPIFPSHTVNKTLVWEKRVNLCTKCIVMFFNSTSIQRYESPFVLITITSIDSIRRYSPKHDTLHKYVGRKTPSLTYLWHEQKKMKKKKNWRRKKLKKRKKNLVDEKKSGKKEVFENVRVIYMRIRLYAIACLPVAIKFAGPHEFKAIHMHTCSRFCPIIRFVHGKIETTQTRIQCTSIRLFLNKLQNTACNIDFSTMTFLTVYLIVQRKKVSIIKNNKATRVACGGHPHWVDERCIKNIKINNARRNKVRISVENCHLT